MVPIEVLVKLLEKWGLVTKAVQENTKLQHLHLTYQDGLLVGIGETALDLMRLVENYRKPDKD